MLSAGLLVVFAGLIGAAVIGADTAHRKARIAADLGVLAGAPLVPRGESAACDRAARVITANGARPVRCEASGLTLSVRVALDVEPWPGLRATTHVEARAGPATAPAGPDDLPDPPSASPARSAVGSPAPSAAAGTGTPDPPVAAGGPSASAPATALPGQTPGSPDPPAAAPESVEAP